MAAPLARADDWQEIEKGLSYKKIALDLNGTPVVLHAIKANLKHNHIQPIYYANPMNVKKMVEKSEALVAINANFFDTNYHPLGLVIENREEKHPLRQISWWAVFCMKNQWASVIHTSEYQVGTCHQAVQAGPRLVISGITPILKEETSRKTAVGINKRGEVIFVVSEQSIPIRELAAMFRRPENENGLDCVNAINMDGGSSSQLYVKAKDFTLSVPSFVNVPVGLGIFSGRAR